MRHLKKEDPGDVQGGLERRPILLKISDLFERYLYFLFHFL
jgi:hypothetical protein